MGSREPLGLVQLRALRVFHGFSRFRTPTAARCSSPSSIRAEIFMDERPGDPFEAAMHLFSREKCPRTGGNTVSHREKASSASGKRRFRWENRFSAKERALSQLENVFFQSTKHVAGAPSAFRAWKRHVFGENEPSPARNGRFQAGKNVFPSFHLSVSTSGPWSCLEKWPRSRRGWRDWGGGGSSWDRGCDFSWFLCPPNRGNLKPQLMQTGGVGVHSVGSRK